MGASAWIPPPFPTPIPAPPCLSLLSIRLRQPSTLSLRTSRATPILRLPSPICTLALATLAPQLILTRLLFPPSLQMNLINLTNRIRVRPDLRLKLINRMMMTRFRLKWLYCTALWSTLGLVITILGVISRTDTDCFAYSIQFVVFSQRVWKKACRSGCFVIVGAWPFRMFCNCRSMASIGGSRSRFNWPSWINNSLS